MSEFNKDFESPSIGTPSSQQLVYAVDMIFNIDGTGSMIPLIEMVKKNALKIAPDLKAKMVEKNKTINKLRIKIIVFRDYEFDGADKAMKESEFFNFPEDQLKFESYVKNIAADGGGSTPENSLEALAYAIKSDWNNSQSDRKRQVIVSWTDAPAHSLESMQGKSGYPTNLPKDLNELHDLWEKSLPSASKRLVLFCPNEYPWNQVSESFDNAVHFPARAGQGLGDNDYNQIINLLAESIG